MFVAGLPWLQLKTMLDPLFLALMTEVSLSLFNLYTSLISLFSRLRSTARLTLLETVNATFTRFSAAGNGCNL